jgi:ubiquinone/menaquinone biosynthesis C-methylase UbiE
MNAIVDTYSKLAEQYDDARNLRSCWGRSADQALASIRLQNHHRVVMDVGCGTGRALARLAQEYGPHVRFIGVDPAPNMRAKAAEAAKHYGNIDIIDGAFERLPVESASVDYLYSIYAFHWATDLKGSVQELARVLTPSGEMDLFFTGRHNGREFLPKTSPIYLKYMGPALLLQSAGMRKQITKDAARMLFESAFDPARVVVDESYHTFHDSLDDHWSWWVRAEGHFVRIPAERRRHCDEEIKRALSELSTDQGIPYTIHLIHVRVKMREATLS